MGKIKILQVMACMTYGGTEAFVMNHYRRIDKEKYQYDFWIFNDKICDYREEIIELNEGKNNIYSGCNPQISKIVDFVDKLTRFIKKNKYDVVHSHVNLSNAFVMIAAKRAGVKVRISHAHDSKPRDKRKIGFWVANILRRKLLNKYANVYLACSEIAGEYVYGKNNFAAKGLFMANGIETTKFQKSEDIRELKRRFRLPDNAYIIGNITRFEEKKNPLFLIKIFRELLNYDSTLFLVMGGPDGGQLKDAQELVKKLKIEKNVRFIGTTTEISKWLKVFDIYVFPSKYEGLPITLLENQASGIYSLVSDGVINTVDLGLGLISFVNLEDGEAKWAHDILEYKKKGRKIVDSSTIRKKFIEQGFDISESVRKLESIYQKSREVL